MIGLNVLVAVDTSTYRLSWSVSYILLSVVDELLHCRVGEISPPPLQSVHTIRVKEHAHGKTLRCIYVCTCICICIYVYVGIYMYICICRYIHVYVSVRCMYVLYVYVVYMYMYVCVYFDT